MMQWTTTLRITSGFLLSFLVTSCTSISETRDCGLIAGSSKQQLVDSLTPTILDQLSTMRGYSQSHVCSMPEERLRQSLDEISRAKQTNGKKAREIRDLQLRSSNGEINTTNWAKALEQVEAMQQYAPSITSAGLGPGQWESIGPGNIGGRVRALAFDPDNSDRMYVGGVTGGVWISDDAGQSWSAVDDYMTNLSVVSFAFDPGNSNILYAGTGERVRGLGIFRSLDKGQSWSSLSSTQNNPNFYYVRRIAIVPGSGRILAATSTGVWTSDDSGSNWTQTRPGGIWDVELHPFNEQKLIGGTSGSAIYSTDGGLSWSESSGLSNIGGRVEVAYSKSNPDIVYASVNLSQGEIWKSVDGGESYSLSNTGTAYMGNQGNYDNAIWVDPTDSSHVVVGGLILLRSTDGGATWNSFLRMIHADQHLIIEHPNYDGVTNKQIYVTNDGGLYSAQDTDLAAGNVGWDDLNNGLGVTQFYGVAVGPDGTVVGGTQDNGALVFKGDSEKWFATHWGDGGFSATDPTNSQVIYSEYQGPYLQRSDDGGLTSTHIGNSAIQVGAIWINTPFILDPNNENRLLLGARELWLSDNPKASVPSWVSIKAPDPSLRSISALAVAPGNSDIIFVGYINGNLYRTENGTSLTPTWAEVGSLQMPSRWLHRIAIDPMNSGTIYASFGGYEVDNLWKSIDGGNNWNPAVGSGMTSIPPAPIRAIAIHPAESNQIYVGTELGIFSSENGGGSWSINNDGPANVSIEELVWDGAQTLYAATHGRGIFRATVDDVVPGGNRAPVLDSIGDKRISLGVQLVIPLSASDADGDLISFGDSGLPEFCDPLVDNGDGSGSIVCLGISDNIGQHRFSVFASDDGVPKLKDSETITLTVYQNGVSTFVSVGQVGGYGTPAVLDGSTLVVGAGGSGDLAFAQDIGTDNVIQVYANPNPLDSGAFTDFYGTAVNIANGRVLVSAEGADVASVDSGAVYLFDVSTGALLETFTHPSAAANQAFGRSIAMHGNSVLIGSFAFPYAMLFDATSGAQLDTFTQGPVTQAGSLALSDNFIVVGDATRNSSSGAVHVYDAATHNSNRTIFNPTPSASDFFGGAVAVDGNRILIGGRQVDIDGVANAGEAYLFDMTTGVLLHTFVDPTPTVHAFFGGHLDIEGDIVAISASGSDEVHIFDAVTGSRIQTIVEHSLFQFGTSVSLDQGYLAIGAIARGVYLYRLRRFLDVPPDHWAFTFIEKLAESALTSGCGGNNYCPTSPVTRAQMAVFLERGMRGSGYSPPAATGTVFLDVSVDDFAANYIEQLFQDGITAGCGNNNYCPDATVTRDQMAVFLLRAKFGRDYRPPAANGTFGDVTTSHWAAPWIEQLAAEGITAGCGAGNYCPGAEVTRDQMAVFLVRTFGL